MVTKKDLMKNELFKKLFSLNLSIDEYVIFGSGVMFAIGARALSELDDLDIFVNEDGWNKVKNLSTIIHDDGWDCEHIYLFDKRFEIYNGWGPGEYDIEDMVENALRIGDIPFASIEDVIRWKKELGRAKDLKHIDMIESHLKANT